MSWNTRVAIFCSEPLKTEIKQIVLSDIKNGFVTWKHNQANSDKVENTHKVMKDCEQLVFNFQFNNMYDMLANTDFVLVYLTKIVKKYDIICQFDNLRVFSTIEHYFIGKDLAALTKCVEDSDNYDSVSHTKIIFIEE